MPNLREAIKKCKFPWVLSNVRDVATGAVLGGADYVSVTAMFEAPTVDGRGTVKVGVMGLAEEDWLSCISCVPRASMQYDDLVASANTHAAALRAAGAELVLAVTHFRVPNDERLATEALDVDLILGGHDHMFYASDAAGPRGVTIVKRGTDFQYLKRSTACGCTLEPPEPTANTTRSQGPPPTCRLAQSPPATSARRVHPAIAQQLSVRCSPGSAPPSRSSKSRSPPASQSVTGPRTARRLRRRGPVRAGRPHTRTACCAAAAPQRLNAPAAPTRTARTGVHQRALPMHLSILDLARVVHGCTLPVPLSRPAARWRATAAG